MYYFLLIPLTFFALKYKQIFEILNYSSIYLYPKNPIVINSINSNSINGIIEKINNSKTNSITFYINSNGGEVLSGFELITQMEILKTMDITFDCYAIKAASMAFDIFQHCNNRFVMPNTYLMQHSATITGNWTMEELQFMLNKDYFNTIIRINENLDTYTANKLNMKYEKYKKLIKDDLILNTGEDILDLNCADDIIRISDTYMFDF